jgi:hypothetical protein
MLRMFRPPDPIDYLSSMETIMPSHTSEMEVTTEIDYWRRRVASLEMLVCELLVKNQYMRSDIAVMTPEPARSIRL